MTIFDDTTTTPAVGEVAATGNLTWPERAAHYHKVIGRSAFVSYEDGWAYGMWFLGNSWAVKSGYYGGYPQGYLKRLRALFPDKRRALHLFSGKVDATAFPGDTCDVNASLAPTFVADAHTLEGVPIEDYDLILADPPYSGEDADHYGTPLVSRNKVVELLSHRMQLGAHLAWLDQAQPMYAKARLKPEAAIGIVRSTMHRYRCLLIWQRVQQSAALNVQDEQVGPRSSYIPERRSLFS
jgi:hypothetical protein